MCKSLILPPLIEFNGDWNSYLSEVYNRFCIDFVHNQPFLEGKPVAVRKIPETDGKGYGFWHCISEGVKEEERIPDIERCKHIGWIRAIIDGIGYPEIGDWMNQRGSNRCRLLWYREEFLVVLAERQRKSDGKQYYLLLTAYCTTSAKSKKRLRLERDLYKRPMPSSFEDGT